MIYAVDFDGTLFQKDKFPDFGDPNYRLISFLKREQQKGNRIILWTCREGPDLAAAVQACQSYGLRLDAVNDNLPDVSDRFGHNSRKVFADRYIDDRSSLPEWLGRVDDSHNFVTIDAEKRISRVQVL